MELYNPNPKVLLAHYIRDTAGLHGTKLGCEEGGCGACTVSLTKKEGTRSINSCLRPLCANDGMGIMTVEGIGSVQSGLSVEQQSIVENNGTQCGFCTPGLFTVVCFVIFFVVFAFEMLTHKLFADKSVYSQAGWPICMRSMSPMPKQKPN